MARYYLVFVLFNLVAAAADPIEIKIKMETTKQVNPLFDDRIFDLKEAMKSPPATPRIENYTPDRKKPAFSSPFTQKR